MAEGPLLDSSAVLALLQAEAGAAAVQEVPEEAAISAASRTEILARLDRFGADGTPALTADRAWAALGVAVEVRLIR
jgi:PIN domain nuclease of toxin-antitoxin system